MNEFKSIRNYIDFLNNKMEENNLDNIVGNYNGYTISLNKNSNIVKFIDKACVSNRIQNNIKNMYL